MPVAEGGVDIPALEWCTVTQAAMWIEHRQLPVDFFHAGALPDRIYAPLLEYRSELDFCMDGWNKLFVLACAGGVPFRGYPAIGFENIESKDGTALIRCESYGDLELIPAEKIVQAGLAGFISDGLILYYDLNGTKWAYSLIQVDFRALIGRHPPAKGQEFRIGGDLMLVQPMMPSDVMSVRSIDQSTESRRSKTVVEKPKAPASPPKESSPKIEPVVAVPGLAPAAPVRQTPLQGHHLRTQDAADYLGLSKSTLEKYRLSGDGPQYVKMGKAIAYKTEDLDAWVDARKRNSTSESTIG